MATNEQIHQDLKDIAQKLTETNELLVKVVTDNEHRDRRMDSQDKEILSIKTEISAMKNQRTADREEYKPVWDKSKNEQETKAGFIRNGLWIFIVCLVLVVSNSISSGAIKLPMQGKVKNE